MLYYARAPGQSAVFFERANCYALVLIEEACEGAVVGVEEGALAMLVEVIEVVDLAFVSQPVTIDYLSPAIGLLDVDIARRVNLDLLGELFIAILAVN